MHDCIFDCGLRILGSKTMIEMGGDMFSAHGRFLGKGALYMMSGIGLGRVGSDWVLTWNFWIFRDRGGSFGLGFCMYGGNGEMGWLGVVFFGMV